MMRMSAGGGAAAITEIVAQSISHVGESQAALFYGGLLLSAVGIAWTVSCVAERWFTGGETSAAETEPLLQHDQRPV